jgi:TPR repeat protein
VRAAELGSGPAAVAVGRSYDPAFAAIIGAVSIPSDPAIAAAWYAKAVERGEREAGILLAQLLARAGGEVAGGCPTQGITAPRHAPSDLHSGSIDRQLRMTCSRSGTHSLPGQAR